MTYFCQSVAPFVVKCQSADLEDSQTAAEVPSIEQPHGDLVDTLIRDVLDLYNNQAMEKTVWTVMVDRRGF